MNRRDLFKQLAGLTVCSLLPSDIGAIPKIEPVVFNNYGSYFSWLVQREIDYDIIKRMIEIVDREKGCKTEIPELREPVEGIDYIFSKDFKMT